MFDPGVDLEQLRALVCVAEVGSIRQAADRLTTSRARVRRLLDQLEASLGCALVVRNRDGMSLTPAGEEFVPRARRVLGDVSTLVSATREQEPELPGTLRVGLQVGYPHQPTMTLLTAISRAFRRLRIQHIVHPRPVELLPDKADVVICLGVQQAKVPVTRLRVFTLRQRLFGSVAYVQKHGPFSSIDEALPHLYGVWADSDQRGDVLHFEDGGSLTVEPSLVTNDEQLLLGIAERGLGLVYAPVHSVGEDLVPVLEDSVGREVSTYLVGPEMLTDVPRMRFFMHFMRRLAQTWR